jgi:hypothetical protein
MFFKGFRGAVTHYFGLSLSVPAAGGANTMRFIAPPASCCRTALV